MALIVVAVIIAMSLILGAEQGPKADPTSTTYVPRPEWYFFFLFEVLRVIKPPELVPIATIGIPTICMVLLLLLPFYDRGPERRPERRPIATTAGCLTIIAMAYLTYLGADRPARRPRSRWRSRRSTRRARRSSPAAGCLACHKIGENGNNGPGPGADPHRRADPARGDHPLGRNRPGHHALLPRPAAEKAQRARRLPLLARLSRLEPLSRTPRERGPNARHRSRPRGLGPVRRAGQPHVRPVAGRYDALNSVMTAGLHHRWRERAADRAELGPGDSALDVCCGTGDLALELAGRVAPRRQRRRLRLLRADARPGPREGGRARRRRRPLRVGRRARAPLRRRPLRRGHGRLRRPQPRRPRPRPARDGPGAEAGRARGDPRDHPADPAAALDLLLALVRPHRAAARHASPATARPTPTCPSRCAASPARAALAEKMDARRLRADPLHGARRRDHRDPQRRRGRDPPLGGPAAGHRGPRRREPLAAGAARRGRGRCCAAQRAGHGEALAEDATATLAAGGKRLRPLLVLLCAGAGGGRGRGARARPRSSWSTWRRWSTTTSSTTRRCAAAGRPSPRPRAASARPPTGDLLFSRAFALLAAAGDGARGGAARARPSVALARGELAQRHDAFDLAITEQRYLERCRLKTARLFECACLMGSARDEDGRQAPSRARCAPSAPRSGSPSSCSTTCSTSPGPPERTGKARGTDLLDGTVTLPLILAARARPGISRSVDLRGLDAARRRGALRPDRRHRARWSGSARGRWRWSPRPSADLQRRRLRRRAAPAARARRRRRRRALQLEPAR